jgi:hypothetical protein
MWQNSFMPIFLERFCIAVCAALEVANLVSNPLHLSLPLRIAVGVLLALLGLLFAILAHRPNQKKTSGPKSLVTPPQPVQADPPQNAPAKPVDRIIVNVSPEYLLNFFKEHTSIQAQKLVSAYVGKWMRLSGQVQDITSTYPDRIAVSFNPHPYVLHVVFMFFDEIWKDRLAILRRGDQITVVGQINDAGPNTVNLFHCELLDSGL